MDQFNSETEAIAFLAKNPEKIFEYDDSGNTALHILADKRFRTLQKKLLDEHPSLVSSRNDNGETPLFGAIDEWNVWLVERIIHIDPSVVTMTDKDGTTPFIFSIIEPYPDLNVVKLLLPFTGVEDKMRFMFGTHGRFRTLHSHIIRTYPEVCECRFDDGDTILHALAHHDNVDCIELVKELFGNDLAMIANDNGEYPLEHASHYRTFLTLFDMYPEALSHIDIDCLDIKTLKENLDKFVPMLKQMPQILSAKDRDGKTIAMNAAREGTINRSMVKAMFEANPESFLLTNRKRQTFMHDVARYKPKGWETMLDHIIDAYPRVLDMKDKHGKTCIEYALQNHVFYPEKKNRARFVSRCLRYRPIPECWDVFVKPSWELSRSFGAILARSEEEASHAILAIERDDRIRVQNICKYCNLPRDILKKIIAKL
jgi:ankyrin repeat protein